MKIFFTLLISFLLLNATEMGLKGGGCSLAQEGKVVAYYNGKFFHNVTYRSNKKSGKNFREIFVGSSILVDNIKIEITDYKPNKRVKGKPKTGVFLVKTTVNSVTKNITMTYIFDKGIISATGVLNDTTIGFTTKVNYSLCSVSL